MTRDDSQGSQPLPTHFWYLPHTIQVCEVIACEDQSSQFVALSELSQSHSFMNGEWWAYFDNLLPLAHLHVDVPCRFREHLKQLLARPLFIRREAIMNGPAHPFALHNDARQFRLPCRHQVKQVRTR